MIVNNATLTTLAQGFNAAFLRGFGTVAPSWNQVAMEIPSTSDAENYGWMKDLPGMREWVGPRVYNNLESATAQLRNKTWEHTIAVKRDAIEDDKLGIYANLFSIQGEVVGRHPDDLVWGLLAAGFTTPGFDGQYFFDTDHVTYSRAKAEVSWSNNLGGSGKPWFLMDLSRAFMKPLIFQSRRKPSFTPRTNPADPHVFDHNEFVFGADARYNAGFGFHQLAVGSKQTLDATAFDAARIALASQFRPDGSPLGVHATHLVVGPTNEAAARELLQAERDAAGATNIWRGAAQLIVSPWLE
ncbi:Mu-like prophage major head subunit gpT family protein [Thauera aromatica]|uniref:Mu-like prophage major head subunit gpT family protein n=1 Tax=Thauera aromatica TaxID=59405 RepID=UPI001FFD75B3|nr:Mu-like prophage major head subunit gpT family protein [Thauera aromatica]MCK2095632.1 Mu-like prophage major head subunit gpT family protein [Thauera aromatica]